MKKALSLFTALLAVSAPTMAEELLLNGDFQIGVPQDDKPPSFDCKWWRRELWAEDAWNSWLTDGARDWQIGEGNQALQFRWGATSIYQFFSAAPGESYDFSARFYNAGANDNRWQPRIQVEWYDANDALIGSLVTVTEANVTTDPVKVWNTLSGSAVAPAETAYARLMLNVNNRGEGNYWQSMYLDDASVTGVRGTGNLPCSFISAPYDLKLEAIYESSLYMDTLTNYADDKDGDALTFTTHEKPAWLTIAPNGDMSGTPTFYDAGDNLIHVTVEDGQGHSDTRELTLPVIGHLRPAHHFDSDMVLQRGAPIPVWGRSVSNAPVNVSMSTGESANAMADENGEWEVTLPAMSATTNGPISMTITSDSRVLTLTNLLVGDVWFCSGQSNMDWGLWNTENSDAEIAAADFPNLRYVGTPPTTANTPWSELDARAIWQETTPETAGDFSAVAYYFGKNLTLNTEVPIGLIKSAQGGTSIEKWAVNLSSPGTETFYNSRVHPYTRMPITGAIWYQAEANVSDGAAYTPKMETLVADWRAAWNQGDFPFYYVQLASYDYPSHEPHVLPEMWAAQTAALDVITNAGMVVITDVSDITNIHPQNKAPVGERLARWARHDVYGETNLVHSGPIATSAARENGAIRVGFDHVGSGLASRDTAALNWFEIAAADQVYTSATATIEGDAVVVSHPSVSNPKWVRFAWNEIAEPNLMNAEGLTANAFTLSATGTVETLRDVLINGDFETGTVEGWMPADFDAPPWSRATTGGDIRNVWLTDDSNYAILGEGNNALIIRWANSSAVQDFPVSAGEEHLFSARVLSSKATNHWAAVMQVLWLDADAAPIGSEILLDQADPNAPANVWAPLSGSAAPPADAVTGRLSFSLTNTGSKNHGLVYFDDAAVRVPDDRLPAEIHSTEFNWEQFANTSGVSARSFDITTNGVTLRLTVEASTHGVPVNLGNSVFAESLGVAGGIKDWELDQGSLTNNPLDDESLTFSLEIVEGAETIDSLRFAGVGLRLFGTVDKVEFSDHEGLSTLRHGAGSAAGANANVFVDDLSELTPIDLDHPSDWRFTVTALDSDANDGTDLNTKTTRLNVNTLRFDYALNVSSLPPSANDDHYETAPGTSLSVETPSVLVNDTDLDGDALSAVLDSTPNHGSLAIFGADGSFVYTPNAGFHGTDAFDYRVTDGVHTSGSATVTITVDNAMSVANVFNHDMVLQREQRVPVRGLGNPGERVDVAFGGQSISAETTASGVWEAWLEPMPANTTPDTLEILTPRGDFAFTNVLVGDVWLCSGQSNMDRPLDTTNPEILNKTAEIAAANHPLIRLMNVPLAHEVEPRDDLNHQAVWNVCDTNSAADFSATGYFFGREIHLETGVPVGLIESAVGGTRVERWMPEDPRDELGYTYNDRVTQLYNGMIHPITRFPIKGAIWYQGESNAYEVEEQIALYKDKFESLILGWRDAWNVGEFPFYFAQVAPHDRGANIHRLPTLWRAFTASLNLPNTGMISLNDLSEPGDITEAHPANKQDVGARFAALALEKTYGIAQAAWSGPLFDSAVLADSSVRVYFDPDTLGDGLATRDGQAPTGFELAGADGVFHTNANAVIDGETLLVSHPSVTAPAFVRFGWNGNQPHNLMNAEAWPADTFSENVFDQSPPFARPDVFTTDFGRGLVLDVLANDTDLEGDALIATIVDDASRGDLTATNGAFLYTPAPGFHGTDRFTYAASDGVETSEVVMVAVRVGEPEHATVRLPRVFGSNMVLQRDHPLSVWGWGPAGQTIAVSIGDESASAVVNLDGTWATTLPAMGATNGPLSLAVSTLGSSLTLTNLAIGDVWLACGQSNMGWKLANTDGGPEEAATADYPLYRFIKTPIIGKDEPQDDIEALDPEDRTARWRVVTPESAGDMTAIGYYFGRDIHTNLNIPVGVIQSAYAGTSVEAWSKSPVPNAQPDDALFVPAKQLYNAMLNPYIKTPIKGAIWRQGDSNRDDGFSYAEKVRSMVTEWRELWNVGDFPFYYARNPTVFTYPEDPAIPLFWEGQTEIMKVLPNSKMVVISDLSDGSNVHPRDKAGVGERLALRALKNTYGWNHLVDSGPMFSHATFEGDAVRAHFTDVGSGLEFRGNGEGSDWFELCGPDGVYTNASVVIDGETLVVSAPSVARPIGIRYAWSKYAIGDLFNAEGLPANSFRLAPPLAAADRYGVHVNTTLYVKPAGLLANDSEGSNHRALQRIVRGAAPAHGALTARDDGAFIYEPFTDFSGFDSFTYAVTDGVETSPETTVEIEVLSLDRGTGGVNRDVWHRIPGYDIGDLTADPRFPETPDESGFISRLDAPRDVGNDYGQRIYGYLHPPTNRTYTFWIASSARSEFWLGDDAAPSNLIRRCHSWDTTPENWNHNTVNQSEPVALEAGRIYYFEILHKENSGTDHVSVAWDLTPGETNVIESAYLSGFPIQAPALATYGAWLEWHGLSGDDHLLAYAFNLDPASAQPEGLPAWAMNDAEGLSVEYLRRKAPSDLSYRVEFSAELDGNWEPAAEPETVTPVSANWERVNVEDHAEMESTETRFGRVSVSTEEPNE